MIDEVAALAEERARRRRPSPVPSIPPPQAVELADLLAQDFPPAKWLVDGLLREQDAALLHAWRGVGKSRVAHGLGLAVAAGCPFLRWQVPEPRGVLLVDGELPGRELQARLTEQVAGMEKSPVAPFRVLCRDLVDRLPPLTEREGQAAVEANLDGVSLLLFDSISTLGPGGAENDAESWDRWQEWLLKLRREGIAALALHHDGKGGAQRGTSRREDVLALVLQLVRPAGYRPSEGARFEIHVRKGRHLVGADAEPIEAGLTTDEDGCAAWAWKALDDARASQVAKLLGEGMTQRQIAKELKVSLGTVNKLAKVAKDDPEPGEDWWQK